MIKFRDKMKIQSVRLRECDVQAIDEWCSSSTIFGTSDVIRYAVILAAHLCREDRVREILGFHPDSGDVLDEFVMKYHRHLKP